MIRPELLSLEFLYLKNKTPFLFGKRFIVGIFYVSKANPMKVPGSECKKGVLHMALYSIFKFFKLGSVL